MQYPNIEVERMRALMTKAELAEALNVNEKTVYNWQNGITVIPVTKLVEMMRLFGCSADYLLGLAPR